MAASYEGGGRFSATRPGCGMGGYGAICGCSLQLKNTQVVSRCSDYMTIQLYLPRHGWLYSWHGHGHLYGHITNEQEKQREREKEIRA